MQVVADIRMGRVGMLPPWIVIRGILSKLTFLPIP